MKSTRFTKRLNFEKELKSTVCMGKRIPTVNYSRNGHIAKHRTTEHLWNIRRLDDVVESWETSVEYEELTPTVKCWESV